MSTTNEVIVIGEPETTRLSARPSHWLSAAAAVGMFSLATYDHQDFGPRYSPTRRRKLKRKTPAQIKRRKTQKAQRLARRKNRS